MVKKIITLIILLSFSLFSKDNPKIIHVITALCDNETQGIVPVPEKIGDGNIPGNNLYWGCSGGVKSTFLKSKEWKLITVYKPDSLVVIERALFKHRTENIILVADAYRGKYIRQSLSDLFSILSGTAIKNQDLNLPGFEEGISAGSKSSLVVFLGHNGLMDFTFTEYPPLLTQKGKDCIILCCKSRQYFSHLLKSYNSNPILLTEQLMYPGAMVLEAAVKGWIKGEGKEEIRRKAAESYAKNQGISFRAAQGIFTKL